MLINRANFIHPAVVEETFVSPVDGTRQTYLAAEFGQPGSILVVYLHGALSHQEQGMTAGIYANVFGRLAEWLQQQRAVYLCPEYRGNSWMGPVAEQDVLTILQRAKSRWQPRRTLLVGGSMGGTSALMFAARHPDQVDGVLAFCPATDPAEMYARFPEHFDTNYGGSPTAVAAVYRERTSWKLAANLAKLPLAVIHGAADTVIPVHHSRRLIEELRRQSGQYKYMEQPNGSHDDPLSVDANPFLDFLISSGAERCR